GMNGFQRAVFAAALFCAPVFLRAADPGPAKYGFLGRTDDDLVKAVRRVDAAILGAARKMVVKEGGEWDIEVTVIDCYKGSLKPGDKVLITIFAEEGPKPEEETGNKRFYFLTTSVDKPAAGFAGRFDCDWTDNARYERYGEPMRKVLKSMPQREIATLDALLAPAADKVVANPEADTDPGVFVPPSPGRYQTLHTLLSMRWVSRAELLQRRRFWEQCAATHTVPASGVTCSEFYEGICITDNGVCRYDQSVIYQNPASHPAFTPLTQENYDQPVENPVWKTWLPPVNGEGIYRRFVGFSKMALAKPGDTSWCVITEYFADGKSHVAHFYVPSRLEIQSLIGDARRDGEDISQWSEYDKRLWAPPEWLTRGLKYDPAIFPAN
ncbi:MAG TPA: hypothetical protein VG733_02300, partial [Chthoniobacteraceae bacterium]|nr:hypothetical protein [Chthoniobacteraceae bacterium]